MPAEDNKAIVRAMFDASNAANVEQAIRWTAPDCLLNGEAYGREGDRMRTTAMVAAFPDGKWILDDAISEGDRVVVRYTFQGTHQGELLGIPPTGKSVIMTGISIYRVVNGLFTEIWESYDKLGLMQQLGVIPATA